MVRNELQPIFYFLVGFYKRSAQRFYVMTLVLLTLLGFGANGFPSMSTAIALSSGRRNLLAVALKLSYRNIYWCKSVNKTHINASPGSRSSSAGNGGLMCMRRISLDCCTTMPNLPAAIMFLSLIAISFSKSL